LVQPQHITKARPSLPFDEKSEARFIIPGYTPYYTTALGDAYVAESLSLLKAIPDAGINVVITSPPCALHFKKEYGNADKRD
jgi:hypothetical protein